MSAEQAPSSQKALQVALDELAVMASKVAVLYIQEETQESLPGTPSIYRDIGLHSLLMTAVYSGALPEVMDQARGNQSRAAEIYDISRGTLRKRLKEHGLLEECAA